MKFREAIVEKCNDPKNLASWKEPALHWQQLWLIKLRQYRNLSLWYNGSPFGGPLSAALIEFSLRNTLATAATQNVHRKLDKANNSSGFIFGSDRKNRKSRFANFGAGRPDVAWSNGQLPEVSGED